MNHCLPCSLPAPSRSFAIPATRARNLLQPRQPHPGLRRPTVFDSVARRISHHSQPPLPTQTTLPSSCPPPCPRPEPPAPRHHERLKPAVPSTSRVRAACARCRPGAREQRACLAWPTTQHGMRRSVRSSPAASAVSMPAPARTATQESRKHAHTNLQVHVLKASVCTRVFARRDCQCSSFSGSRRMQPGRCRRGFTDVRPKLH